MPHEDTSLPIQFYFFSFHFFPFHFFPFHPFYKFNIPEATSPTMNQHESEVGHLAALSSDTQIRKILTKIDEKVE